ncbi:MAG: hypothetical protein ACE5KA_06585 [Nitrososphaerales archaeon]
MFIKHDNDKNSGKEKGKENNMEEYRERNTPKNRKINDLIEEMYGVKDRLKDIPNYKRGEEKKALLNRKDELLIILQEQLAKIDKTKADKIKKKLYNDLGVFLP